MHNTIDNILLLREKSEISEVYFDEQFFDSILNGFKLNMPIQSPLVNLLCFKVYNFQTRVDKINVLHLLLGSKVNVSFPAKKIKEAIDLYGDEDLKYQEKLTLFLIDLNAIFMEYLDFSGNAKPVVSIKSIWREEPRERIWFLGE